MAIGRIFDHGGLAGHGAIHLALGYKARVRVRMSLRIGWVRVISFTIWVGLGCLTRVGLRVRIGYPYNRARFGFDLRVIIIIIICHAPRTPEFAGKQTFNSGLVEHDKQRIEDRPSN